MSNLLVRDAQHEASSREHRGEVLDFVRSEDDDGKQTYTFPLSSETPYRRWRGNEVLVHTKDAVDLSFLNSGTAPLLHQHNQWSGQIGVIERAWLDDKKKRVYVEVRFSRRPEAQAVKQDVDDGIMRNVSVGYNVLQIEHTERDDDAPSEYRVTSWKPMEASIVSIPADETVGVGRATQSQEGTMPAENQQGAGATPNGTAQRSGGLPSAAPTNVLSDEVRSEREAQSNEIMALARTHNMADMGTEFVQAALVRGETPSLAAFRGKLREALPDDVPLVNNDVGLNENETQRFSLMRLARAMADGATDREIADAAFERDACEQAARNFEGDTNGWRLPDEVMRSWSTFEVDGVTSAQLAERAALNTGGNANVQAVDHLAGRFIDNLRNQSSVLRAGVTMLTGLSGNIEIPGGDTNSTAGWLGAEGDDAPETNPSFRKVQMDIKDIAGYTDLTRRMLQQTTIAIEQYVRNQLLIAVALGIDSAGLQGSGAAGVPTGLKNTTGIGSVTFASLGAPTRAEVIELWSDVAVGNAAIGNLNFISNALMVAHFMNERVDPGSGKFMMEGPNSPLLAMNHIMSNQAANNDLFFGNFADLLMGMWGGLDLDRSTESGVFLSGGLRLRAIQSVDFGVSRVGSFSLGNGGT